MPPSTNTSPPIGPYTGKRHSRLESNIPAPPAARTLQPGVEPGGFGWHISVSFGMPSMSVENARLVTRPPAKKRSLIGICRLSGTPGTRPRGWIAPRRTLAASTPPCAGANAESEAVSLSKAASAWNTLNALCHANER